MGVPGGTGLPNSIPRCAGAVLTSTRGGHGVGSGGGARASHTALCPDRCQDPPPSPDWTPPPSWDTHEESMKQPLHARRRGAIFSTSSEVTISFFSKKIHIFSSSLFIILCRFSGGTSEVQRWAGGSAYLDFLSSLPSLSALFLIWAPYPRIAVLKGKFPKSLQGCGQGSGEGKAGFSV